MRDSAIAAVAAGFSMWLIAGAACTAVYQGVLFLFAGVVYAVPAARRPRTA